jgi:hypothetical protein
LIWKLADEIPGSNGFPFIGVIYKFIGVEGGGLMEIHLRTLQSIIETPFEQISIEKG